MKEEIEITSIKMPFLNMVWFIIKWTLASIMALFILAILFITIGMVATMITGESLNIDTTMNQFSSHFHSYQFSK
jgi:hypothetical protein